MEINRPDVVAAVTAAFERYEQAFQAGDVAVMDELFWDDQRVVRFGVADVQYGAEEVRRFRVQAPSDDLPRTLTTTTITTFGDDFATAFIEFRRHNSGVVGRQSQTWVRFPEGWRIVAAHVSVIPAEALAR